MDKERFEKQLAFALEADKEKNIFRQNHITGYVRRENDAEHAWHMALMIYLLKEYANDPIDAERAMAMALIHDIVEIDAGDTYAYDPAALVTQKEREEQAAERIFGLLPDDQKEALRSLFEEFEAGKTPEARFARTMDNLQPLMLNDANDGRDWKRHRVCAEPVFRRHDRSRPGSEKVWAYSKALIEKNIALGHLRAEPASAPTPPLGLMILPINEENKKDLHVANQPFDIIGRLKLRWEAGVFAYEEELFDSVAQKHYPNFDGATATDYILSSDRAAFFAYLEGECVGQILLSTTWNEYVHIEDLSVAAPFRGKGVGSALLAQATAWAAEKGLCAFSAECQDNNLMASRFFAKNGFVIGGVDGALYKQIGPPYTSETAVFWYKTLV
ncbi:MAG: GNAT family N-acetyltransferase [Clostridia bacterium]|nr:GNAT family N-acetyltransferase [Clostridia bacterium]